MMQNNLFVLCHVTPLASMHSGLHVEVYTYALDAMRLAMPKGYSLIQENAPNNIDIKHMSTIVMCLF